MKLQKSILTGLLLLMASSASYAYTYDFKAMANATGTFGESIWTTFSVPGVSMTATHGADRAYVYLDSGNAGIGVCRTPLLGAPLNTATHDYHNLCAPSSDDNVDVNGETLHLTFAQKGIVSFSFNNNHDADYSLFGDSISINGANYTFTTDYGQYADYNTVFFNVNAGDVFDIGYVNEQFYLGGLKFIPEPATLGLLGLGLVGLGFVKRRRS